MKNNRMTVSGRILFILSGISLFAILFFPIWQIQLSAPQYPEGLILRIYPDKLGGNVDVINGLNHYIGMKPIHAADFIEFTVLPFIIIFYSALFILAGLLGKRRWMNLSFILFVLFGIVAMVDFWKWEYNYGHTLNPDAAIVVPGMSYQPPLIGFKQLLNFGAYSIPDIGGWIFVGVGLILLFVIFREYYHTKKTGKRPALSTLMVMSLISLFVSSCNPGPSPLIPGKDDCQFCKMTISDLRFGAEIITGKGKIFKFDDPGCAMSFIDSKPDPSFTVREIYFTDFSGKHDLIESKNAIFLKSETLKAPMGGNFVCFTSLDSLKKVMKEYPGSIARWDDIKNQ
jgi:copper chaperone NosL